MRYIRCVLKAIGITIIFAVLGFVGLWSYVQVVIYHHRFSGEARLLNRDGQVIFQTVDSRKYHHQKSMDEIAYSAAVFAHSRLWITHLVSSGDRDFAFGSFGRVFVLRPAGIDASEVESVSIWRGSPHDYPFPNVPKRVEDHVGD